jgi:hypothetical protein
MIRKKSIFCFIIFSFLIISFSSAQIFKSEHFSLSFEPYIGFTYGHLGEYIYADDTDGTEKVLSCLEWEEKPLWQYGISVTAAFKRFGVTVSFDRALNIRCGTMYDSDWMTLTDLKTDYSIHEQTAAENMNLTIALQYVFKPDEKLFLAPVIEAYYSYNSFEARNGYGWYGDEGNSDNGENVAWDDPSAHYYRKLCGIDYSRQTLYTFFGGQMTCIVTPKLSLRLGLFLSPYTYTYAADTHYTNLAMTAGNHYHYYQDTFFGRFRLSASLSYRITSCIETDITVRYLSGETGRGDIYSDIDTGKMTLRPKQAGGSSAEEFTLSIGCRIFLF